MKASRLLSELLLLQTHGRMTTTDLAARLEVSRRTILRDVEALSAAGVPVYAERGRQGGIVLMASARLDTARLDPAEIDLLLLAGLDQRALEMLAVTPLAKSASAKLASRQSHTMPPQKLSDIIVVDNTPWATDETPTHVGALAKAVQSGNCLTITYRHSGQERATPQLVEPYGLALKGGRWYLVADAESTPRLFAVSRLEEHRVHSKPVEHPPGQTLATVWETLRAQAEPAGSLIVRARLRSNRVDLARRILGSRLIEVNEPPAGDPDQRTTIRVRYDHPEAVRQLLQFGDNIEIIAPVNARNRIRDLATSIASTHAQPV